MADIKFDTGKPPVSRGFMSYFPRAIAAVADVSQYGFEKYKQWGGWKAPAPDAIGRYEDAMNRHYLALKRGETHDPESGRSHRAMVAWNALAVLELELTDAETHEHTASKDCWCEPETIEDFRECDCKPGMLCAEIAAHEWAPVPGCKARAKGVDIRKARSDRYGHMDVV